MDTLPDTLFVVPPAESGHDVYLADTDGTPFAYMLGGQAEDIAIAERLARGWSFADMPATASTGQADSDAGVLEALEAAYIKFGDIRAVWHGRTTPPGQALLNQMRDAIAKARGISPQEVEADYSTRAGRAGAPA